MKKNSQKLMGSILLFRDYVILFDILYILYIQQGLTNTSIS